MAMPKEFGLELCLRAHAENIKCRSDVVLLMCHWRLLRYSFFCIGDLHYEHHVPSELLPVNLGWCGDTGAYVVKYVYKDRQYVLSVTVSESSAGIKLHSDAEIASLKLDLGNAISSAMEINMQQCLVLCKRLDTDLIETLLRDTDQAAMEGFSDLSSASAPSSVPACRPN